MTDKIEQMRQAVGDDKEVPVPPQVLTGSTLLACQVQAQQARIMELEGCLRGLVALKDEKDQHGKTEHYTKTMPRAWEEARRLLRS